MSRINSILGKRVGSWVVVKRVSKIKIECVCDCGNVRVIHIDSIWKATWLLCKKCRDNNFIGKTFGNLTVIDISKSTIRKRRRFICLCQCGKRIEVDASRLKNGKACKCKSCSSTRNKYGQTAFNELYGIYKRNALKRGFEWSISKDDFRHITKQNCFYTGMPPSCIIKSNNGDYLYNGLDRIDSKRGYVVDNIVPCNKKINKMKMVLNTDEFIELCCMVANYIKKEKMAALIAV